MTSWLCFLLYTNALTVYTAPNFVDCAFRKLAIRTASRNLYGDTAKLAIVAAGLNASDCPGGERWTALFQSRNSTKPPPYVAKPGIHLFVSPAGDDANLGTDITSPLQTLAAAQGRVRKLLREQLEQAITVNLKSGIYFETIAFGPEDSGCQHSTGSSPECRVTWQNYQQDEPVVSGGQQLNCTWTKATINGNVSAYVCKVPAVITANFTSLFVEGSRVQRARYTPPKPHRHPQKNSAPPLTHTYTNARTHADL